MAEQRALYRYGVASESNTFDEGDFATLPPPAAVALAARCVQRVIPLYQRARGQRDDVHREVEFLANAVLWARVFAEDGGYRCSYERAHEAIGQLP